MESLQKFFSELRRIFDFTLIRTANTEFKLWSLINVIVLSFLLFYLTGKLKKWVVERLLANSNIDIGIREAVGSILRYMVIAIGFVIILQTVGINLSTLTILVGALGVGIGFGLQAITNNFFSGLIILFERPIKVGDRIEVGNLIGDVVDISIRATTVITNDNIAVIVPNSEFISSQVVNWSYTDRNVRFNIPVGVAYKEDPEVIRRLLLEVATETPGVLREPKPDVLFDEFGNSSINFNLRVWSQEYINRPPVLRSELYYRTFRKFREHGIEIPFPQRDLHLRSGSLGIAPPAEPADPEHRDVHTPQVD